MKNYVLVPHTDPSLHVSNSCPASLTLSALLYIFSFLYLSFSPVLLFVIPHTCILSAVCIPFMKTLRRGSKRGGAPVTAKLY